MSEAEAVTPLAARREEAASRDVRTGGGPESKGGAESFLGRVRATFAHSFDKKDNAAAGAADAVPERANANGAGVLERLRTFAGAEKSKEASEEEGREAEESRIRKAALTLGTAPILDGDDLKYEGMQPLGGSGGDKALVDWIKRNAAAGTP